MRAARLHPGGPRFEPGRFAALERDGRKGMRPRHFRRLRAAAARIERQLPLAGFPVTSATLAAGCGAIRTDDESCAAIAARELARYAMSARVGRVAR